MALHKCQHCGAWVGEDAPPPDCAPDKLKKELDEAYNELSLIRQIACDAIDRDPDGKLTLAPATIAILDALARRWGIARSRVVDRLAQSVSQLNGKSS